MKNMKRLTALFLSLLMVAVMLPAIDLTSAAAASTPDDRIFDSSYIYFDLYYGAVKITANKVKRFILSFFL